MEVNILIAIVIPDTTPFSPADKQWIWWYSLKRTGDSHRQGCFPSLVNLVRARGTFLKRCFLTCDNLSHQFRANCNRLAQHRCSFPAKNDLPINNHSGYRSDSEYYNQRAILRNWLYCILFFM